MAYGTETVPHVDKIYGPGNIFVVLAKQKLYGVVAIDALPGPTETLLVADETADPDSGSGRSAGAGRARSDGLRHPADRFRESGRAGRGRAWRPTRAELERADDRRPIA